MRIAFTVVALCVTFTLAGAACGRGGVYRFDETFDASVPDAAVVMDASVPVMDASVPDAGHKPCIPGSFGLNRAAPVATFVIDRSASMNDRFGFTTKWDALSAALAQALPPVDQTMQVGGLIFPLIGDIFACTPPGGADLTPAFGNTAALVSLVQANGPSGSTPTAGAIDIAAASVLAVRAADASRALVLATDGEPDCNGALDPTTCECLGGRGLCSPAQCLDDARTIERIAHYADAGLPTYIIGIANNDQSDSEFVPVLNNMAIAGGKPQQNAATQFFAVGNQNELTSALTTIAAQVGSCVFLSTSVPNTDMGIVVTLGNEVVPEFSGWVWSDRPNGELTLIGSFCDQASANLALPLDATISCEPGPN
jgi:hypothetical protein